jgi:hypothetical protein
MINIKEFKLGLPAKTANRLMVRPIINSTSDITCNTYYEVISEEITITQNEAEKDVRNSVTTVLATGNCPITEEEYALWDSDNTVLENIVIKKLGLEREV